MPRASEKREAPPGRPEAGDYVTRTPRTDEAPRLALVLSVRVKTVGRVELLIDDARAPCDRPAQPEWVPAADWELLRHAA